MARGYTSITFTGGPKSGEVVENVSLRGLPRRVTFRTDSYFSQTKNGVVVKTGELDRGWLSCTVLVYEKQPNEKYKSGVVFAFLGTETVDRCEAITKKNDRCIRAAKQGVNYCSSTHK